MIVDYRKSNKDNSIFIKGSDVEEVTRFKFLHKLLKTWRGLYLISVR